MRIIVEQERYNPLIPILESVKKIGCSRSGIYYALEARVKAVAWMITGICELPFLLIAGALKLTSGSLTILFACVSRSPVRFSEGKVEFKWAIKSILGLITLIAVCALSILIPEFIVGKRMHLHTYDKYMFILIPWGTQKSREIPKDTKEDKLSLEGFQFKSTLVEAEDSKIWEVAPEFLYDQPSKKAEFHPLSTDPKARYELHNGSGQPYSIYCRTS